jgi:hypothetical protein
MVCCLKLKNSRTVEPIGFTILGKLHKGPMMVLGNFTLGFKSWVVLSYFSRPLDARGYSH